MSRPRRRRPRPTRRWPVALLAILAAGVVFLLGVGLGIALEEGPEPGPQITSVRTLRPLPLPTETAGG